MTPRKRPVATVILAMATKPDATGKRPDLAQARQTIDDDPFIQASQVYLPAPLFLRS